MSKLLEILNRLRLKIGSLWHVITEYYKLIKLVRFSVLIILALAVIVMIPQGQAALIAMVENAKQANNSQLLWFIASTFFLASMSWYHARILFRIRNERLNPCDKYTEFKKHFPRWLGGLAIAIPTIAVLAIKQMENNIALFLLIMVGFFMLVVYLRRSIFGLPAIEDRAHLSNTFWELNRTTKIMVVVFLLLNPLLLYLFFNYEQRIGPHIGVIAIVMLALSSLVSAGSFFTYVGEKLRIPVLSILVLIAVLSSLVIDNHKVRSLPEKLNTEPTTLRQHFKDWYLQRTDATQTELPVILIAAEGGGIRAAYWTAAILSKLQDQNSDFAKHVYAISGVSGGSLGAAVFNASIYQSTPLEEPTENTCEGSMGTYQCLSKQVLGHDFLSPTVSTMLFTDLFQKFWWLNRFEGRGVTLEKAWERGWAQVWGEPNGKNLFSQSFHSLWQPQDSAALSPPLLFLNSAVVESGQRIIASPIEMCDFSDIFNDALDMFEVAGHSMPLSTAVHNSARFTYISPAGTLKRQDIGSKDQAEKCDEATLALAETDIQNSNDEKSQDAFWIRLVDGGYFENSGATTIHEIMTRLKPYIEKTHSTATTDTQISENISIKPIIIHISNAPGYPERSGNEIGTPAQERFLVETLSPIRVLLKARIGRGHQARAALETLVKQNQGSYFHFRLNKPDQKSQLPLGWMLSDDAMQKMDKELDNDRNNSLIWCLNHALQKSSHLNHPDAQDIYKRNKCSEYDMENKDIEQEQTD